MYLTKILARREGILVEYHIRIDGCDSNTGAIDSPFKTISKAAAIAQAGDVVVVHEGTYREWVNPANGGTPDKRITYKAADGEEVVITGAEVITDWENIGGNVWKTVIPNTLFGSYNPYKEKIYGDWFFTKDKIFHTGEVYLNGKSMYETQTLEEVSNPEKTEMSRDIKNSVFVWYCSADEKETTIWANFQSADPRNGNVEINVRPFVFWPEENLRSYITVKGFRMKQAATQWAPPTALQTGLIGPHWAKGWIIEDNIISDSKCSAISLGKEISTGHNEWEHLKFKQGTQREREVIFRASHGNWNKENIGGHIVRNNIIFDCEQTGIVGHLGCVFSLIENNHIYNIYQKRQWAGAEIAGIKLHAAIDTTIKDNLIHDSYRGVWLDWQAQGTHVTNNIFYDNTSEDFFVEVSHGPYTVDHNIFLSPFNYRDMSQGGAFAHNLFTGKFASRSELNRFTPYHFPHDTDVAGVMTILGGDQRFYNNVFVGDADVNDPPEVRNFWNGGVVVDGVPALVTYTQKPVGTGGYDENPGPTDEKDWDKPVTFPPGSGPKLDTLPLPVFIESNVYLKGAKPYVKEISPVVHSDCGVEIAIDRENYKVTIDIANPELFKSATAKTVTTDLLGVNFQAEMMYEEADGTPFVMDKDYFGAQRPANVMPGPFEINGTAAVRYELGYKKSK